MDMALGERLDGPTYRQNLPRGSFSEKMVGYLR